MFDKECLRQNEKCCIPFKLKMSSDKNKTDVSPGIAVSFERVTCYGEVFLPYGPEVGLGEAWRRRMPTQPKVPRKPFLDSFVMPTNRDHQGSVRGKGAYATT